MQQYVNYAVGDTKNRRGRKAFTTETYYDLAERLKGQYQAFSTFLSYGEDFIQYVEAQNWSVRGWSGESPATFTIFPVDFDASDNLEVAFQQCKSFIDNELIGKGIDTRYFVIYLSGGKGFHVEISASVLNVEQPLANAGFRLKGLVMGWQADYPTIDLSVYNSTSLFRLPGSKHKSGLHKTEIKYEDFTLEHLAKREQWAAEPPLSIRIPELGRPPILIDLPEVRQQAQQEYDYSVETDYDPEATIIPNCVWLQKTLEDPSAGHKDGVGRERRRNAVGILLSAHETSQHNPELQWFMNQLSQHPYMNDARMEDAMKWVREYDRDGEIKCKKTCYSVGCPAAQRKACGTRSPLDWKLKKRALEIITVDEARTRNKQVIGDILEEPGNGVYVINWPVGIGKTHNLLGTVKDRQLTAFYVSPTHGLALQTHRNFEDQGIASRHVASRSYLADNDGFTCLAPMEVELAMQNGYGSHTVCAKCPRMRKPREGATDHLPEDGYEACEYFEQFEGLKDVDAVVGVHNHLFEFMYEQADVARRAVTVIDESPLEALGRTILPIEPAKLALIRDALKAEIATVTAAAQREPGQTSNRGLFSRVAQIMEEQWAASHDREITERLEILKAFEDLFHGRTFNLDLFNSMPEDRLRAIWYETASMLADRTGLARAAGLEEEVRYLCIPFPIPIALELAIRNQVYDPEKTAYLPVQLPDNKILILDATGSNDVYAPVVEHLTAGPQPRPYRFIEHPLVEQPYSHTTQITSSSYGVSRLFDEATSDYIATVILNLHEQHPGRSLIVCHKQHAGFWQDVFGADPTMEVATYGSLKGMNAWQDCVAQYIVGTPFVPDHGIRDLAAKLGQDVPLSVLEESATLKRSMLLAKNGDTAVISRRVYKGYRFHTAIAQMKSQWEVTQAVRLRLYDQHADDKQHLYIFSNVGLKGMYADRYVTLHELAWELQQAKQVGRRELEVKGVAYEQITAWFEELPKGHTFKAVNVPPFAGDRYIRQWLMAACNAGWIEKLGDKKGASYVKLV